MWGKLNWERLVLIHEAIDAANDPRRFDDAIKALTEEEKRALSEVLGLEIDS